MLRSLLFVPGDRPERFVKAATCGADAIIIDLEDSVSLAQKDAARKAVAEYLSGPRQSKTFVRINPLDSGLAESDWAAVAEGLPDAIVLPKAEGAKHIDRLVKLMGPNSVPILPIATETAKAVFELGTYDQCAEHLLGLSWGAEDLPAYIGASTSREDDGSFTPTFETVRSLALLAAHSAGVQAIETVFPSIREEDRLKAYVNRARRDGFTAMLAIHPAQVEIINSVFTPTDEEIAHARAIVTLFEENPDLGVVQLDGQMIDRPHLVQARSILSRVP